MYNPFRLRVRKVKRSMSSQKIFLHNLEEIQRYSLLLSQTHLMRTTNAAFSQPNTMLSTINNASSNARITTRTSSTSSFCCSSSSSPFSASRFCNNNTKNFNAHNDATSSSSSSSTKVFLKTKIYTNSRHNQQSRNRRFVVNSSSSFSTNSATATDVDVSTVTTTSNDKFNWQKNWYPASPVSFLETDAPNAIKILGLEMVVWKTKNGWSCLEDSCPHRRAPLSLGFIDSNKDALVCRYHGWEFAKDGKCVDIPMSIDENANATACNSKKSCASEYPCKVHAGVLWVWPETGADAFLEASVKKCATENFSELQGAGDNEWGMVELPVGYNPALENQFDPSHAEWLHARYDAESNIRSVSEMADFVPMTKFESFDDDTTEGFKVRHGGYNAANSNIDATRVFTAPCSSRSEYLDDKGKPYLSAHILYTPTEPNRTLMFTKFQAYQFTAVQGAGTRKVSVADKIENLFTTPVRNLFNLYIQNFNTIGDARLIFTGLQHGAGNAAYTLGNQDIRAMHGVEKDMKKRGGKWNKAYYLPTVADKGVSAFRTWMDNFTENGNVEWLDGSAVDATPTVSEEEQTERYHRHTKHCRACKAALNELGILEERLLLASKVLLATSLITGFGGALVGNEGLPVLTLSLAGLSLLGVEEVRDMQHEFVSSTPRRGVPKPKLW